MSSDFSKLNIQEKDNPHGYALFRLAFRPFFLGAGVYAVVAVAIWMVIVVYQTTPELMGLSPAIWHAHEMIFGYGLAVIAGFLLTAIKNWTGQQTIRGTGLFVLFMLWMTARALPLTGADIPLAVMAAFDLLFMLMLFTAAARPVIKVKQFSQIGVISKLVLLLLSNALFYLGALGLVEEGVRWGLYSGLYMIIALILVMARRVVPFFIEKGTDNGVIVRNWQWVDVTSLILLMALWLVDVFTDYTTATSIIAAMLFLVHVVRMIGWYTKRLWNKPLLWVLYLAYASVVAGFLLKALEHWSTISPFLSVHALGYGGVGIMTIGMMSRVILGHTGRNILQPPAILSLCFGMITCGAIVRVLFPLFDLGLYVYWIGLSQILWIGAFLIFLGVYTPMLVQSRVDGRDG